MKATYWIYESLGRTRHMFIWSLIFVPVVCIGFLVAIPYGPVGIAAAYTLVMNLSLIPCLAFATRGTPVSLPDTLRVILPMAGSGSIAAVAGLLFSWPHSHMLVQLFFGATTSGLVYLILAGGIVARANVYSALRKRVARLSSGIIGKAMKRPSFHSGTSADEAK